MGVLLFNPTANQVYNSDMLQFIGTNTKPDGSFQYVLNLGNAGVYTSTRSFLTASAALQAAADLVAGVVVLT